MIQKLLIANRGEIACRIIKTARRLGIQTVAVYSLADQHSLHVSLADEAYCLGGMNAQDSYLQIDRIIQAALDAHVCAIHPGYGFLSENPHFANACLAHQIIWVGPPVHALNIMGSKQLAKQLLEKSNVPLTPGYHGDDQSDDTLLTQAQHIGFPILLKAANGGGGKGMRVVHTAEAFFSQLSAARREALAYFADETMLIEKLIEHPRHIEIQIMADKHGNVVHLFERDCSIQRRHQKIIEEAPAPHLAATLREQLALSAKTVAEEIQYEGAGTVEFLVSGDVYYFMEMNTRLQVEHPVTEMITGYDLVEWQLRIADNEALPVSQDDILCQGHAIEVRIYAEDPAHDFLPSIGQIQFLKEPYGEGIRVDTGMQAGSQITQYYDPMIAKLIGYGPNRSVARNRLLMALQQYHIGGVKTNIPFLQAILQNSDFIEAACHTDFLHNAQWSLPVSNTKQCVFFAAAIDYVLKQAHMSALEKDTFSWQITGQTPWQLTYVCEKTNYDITLIPHTPKYFTLHYQNERVCYHILQFDKDCLCIDDGSQRHTILFSETTSTITLYLTGNAIHIQRFRWQALHDKTEHALTSPMPATVVAVLKKTGDLITMGDSLMILEAMKMEHTIYAPRDGIIQHIFYEVGTQVAEGAELIALEPDEPTIP